MLAMRVQVCAVKRRMRRSNNAMLAKAELYDVE